MNYTTEPENPKSNLRFIFDELHVRWIIVRGDEHSVPIEPREIHLRVQKNKLVLFL